MAFTKEQEAVLKKRADEDIFEEQAQAIRNKYKPEYKIIQDKHKLLIEQQQDIVMRERAEIAKLK